MTTLYSGELNAEVLRSTRGLDDFPREVVQPKTVRPIDEVKEDIVAILKQQKASEAARILAEEIQSHWQDGLADYQRKQVSL